MDDGVCGNWNNFVMIHAHPIFIMRWEFHTLIQMRYLQMHFTRSFSVHLLMDWDRRRKRLSLWSWPYWNIYASRNYDIVSMHNWTFVFIAYEVLLSLMCAFHFHQHQRQRQCMSKCIVKTVLLIKTFNSYNSLEITVWPCRNVCT